MKEFKCECRLCLQRIEFVKHLNILKETGLTDSIQFFEKIYDELMNVGLDNNVNKAVIDGSWPTADEQIAWARLKRKGG